MDAKPTAPGTGSLKAQDYKSDLKPVWCPGCGDFAVLSAITKALAELQVPREDAAVVSGIGCSSRIPAYTSVYGFHSIHGRALPIATGLKAARPDLTVFCAGGDGDGFSIGGNHFIHACRRNVDLTYIVMDNEVYGMTKGQASPTTEPDWTGSKLTPQGPGVAPFQPLEIALSAGANFIARGFSGDPNFVVRLIVEAVRHPGFSLVQVLSPCVTFRPEQRAWKETTHADWAPEAASTDRREAFLRLLDDDGFTTGVLYKGHNPVFAPPHPSSANLADLEKGFAL
ncbi:MAG: 2-oxoglutarate synthase [Rhodospirillaceae bacterium BRH_c57]|nr:MAG: 2-oxoglutarate synthase [Rhodospirillaceae bacterium BRH_c57]